MIQLGEQCMLLYMNISYMNVDATFH